MGAGSRGVGARPPSQAAYYVALAGVLALLLLLICYFIYFCVKKVKELVQQEYCSPRPSTPAPPRAAAAAYPVQPVVRDSAKAMAKLCRQLPAPTPVYPAASSPAAQHQEHETPAMSPATAPPAVAAPAIAIHPPVIAIHPPDTLPHDKAIAPTVVAIETPAVR